MVKDRPVLRTAQGFSIIEVLITIVIFSIGFLAMNSLQIASVNSNSSSQRLSTLSSWTADRIEQLLGMDYDTELVESGVADGAAGLDDVGAGVADGFDTSPDGAIELSWNIADDEPMAGTKTIRIIVRKVMGPGQGTQLTMNYVRMEPI